MRLVERSLLAVHPANVCDVRSLSFLGSFCPPSASQEQTDRSVTMENDGPTMIRIVCLPHNSEWITAPFSCMHPLPRFPSGTGLRLTPAFTHLAVACTSHSPLACARDASFPYHAVP